MRAPWPSPTLASGLSFSSTRRPCGPSCPGRPWVCEPWLVNPAPKAGRWEFPGKRQPVHGREGGLSSWRFHFLRLPEMHAARLAALRGLSTEETGNCASWGRPPCTRLGLVRKIKAARILGRKTFITGRLRLGSQGQEMGEFRSHRDAPPRFWLLAALMWATREDAWGCWRSRACHLLEP